jgi:HEPN domain-containing protein
MVETAIIREWIAKADEDFEFALVNLKEGKPFAALICFHFHQSAEKYLKAYIVAHDLGFLKSHDLLALAKLRTLSGKGAGPVHIVRSHANTLERY